MARGSGGHTVAEVVVCSSIGNVCCFSWAAEPTWGWFGSADVQAAWGEEFDSYPCNQAAAEILYPDGVPSIYTLPNFALTEVEGTGITYAEYVAAHSSEWTNIMTNLGFYWADMNSPNPEPDWDNLDWATLTQAAS